MPEGPAAGEAQVVSQLIELGCQHCNGGTFTVAIVLDDGAIVVRCTKCRRPSKTGAKLSPEAHREALERRGAQMLAQPSLTS